MARLLASPSAIVQCNARPTGKPLPAGAKMKDEYDLTKAEQGKFYRPIEELEIPISLDQEIRRSFVIR